VGARGRASATAAGDVKARVFVERPAVEDDDVVARAAPPVELGGADRRRAELVLDDLGERL